MGKTVVLEEGLVGSLLAGELCLLVDMFVICW